MTIECGNDNITVKDIYIGDVFLFGGQSNMALAGGAGVVLGAAVTALVIMAKRKTGKKEPAMN